MTNDLWDIVRTLAFAWVFGPLIGVVYFAVMILCVSAVAAGLEDGDTQADAIDTLGNMFTRTETPFRAWDELLGDETACLSVPTRSADTRM